MSSIFSTCPVLRLGTYKPILLGPEERQAWPLLDCFQMTKSYLLVPHVDKKRAITQVPLVHGNEKGVNRAIGQLFDMALKRRHIFENHPAQNHLREQDSIQLLSNLASTATRGIGEPPLRRDGTLPFYRWYLDTSIEKIDSEFLFFNSHGWAVHGLQKEDEIYGMPYLLGLGWLSLWMVYMDVDLDEMTLKIKAIISREPAKKIHEEYVRNLSASPADLLKFDPRIDEKMKIEILAPSTFSQFFTIPLSIKTTIQPRDHRRESRTLCSELRYEVRKATREIVEIHEFVPPLDPSLLLDSSEKNIFRNSFFPGPEGIISNS